LLVAVTVNDPASTEIDALAELAELGAREFAAVIAMV